MPKSPTTHSPAETAVPSRIGQWDAPVPFRHEEHLREKFPLLQAEARRFDEEQDPQMRAWLGLRLVGRCAFFGVYPPPALAQWLGEAAAQFYDQEQSRFFDGEGPARESPTLQALLGIRPPGKGRDSALLARFRNAARTSNMFNIAILTAHGVTLETARGLVAHKVAAARTGAAQGLPTASDEYLKTQWQQWKKEGHFRGPQFYRDFLAGLVTPLTIQEYLRERFPASALLDTAMREIADTERKSR